MGVRTSGSIFGAVAGEVEKEYRYEDPTVRAMADTRTMSIANKHPRGVLSVALLLDKKNQAYCSSSSSALSAVELQVVLLVVVPILTKTVQPLMATFIGTTFLRDFLFRKPSCIVEPPLHPPKSRKQIPTNLPEVRMSFKSWKTNSANSSVMTTRGDNQGNCLPSRNFHDMVEKTMKSSWTTARSLGILPKLPLPFRPHASKEENFERDEMPQKTPSKFVNLLNGGIDFMARSRLHEGNKYILVAVDYFVKWVKRKRSPTLMPSSLQISDITLRQIWCSRANHK
ncbi:hypothetical protein Tco_0418450 [Tanacetum coccineum]